MNRPSLATRVLQARLALERAGLVALAAALLCAAAAACWLVWLPEETARLAEADRTVADARARLLAPARADSTPEVSPAQARLAAFRAVLGDREQTDAALGTLFRIARDNGLALSQGEYTGSANRDSQTEAYQIVLPVTGPYPAIRHFCEASLRALPYASLDEIGFKRNAAGNATLEARLRFTLHLKRAPAEAGTR